MPSCNFCGQVHDGTKPVCSKCGRKVEMTDFGPAYSLDIETVDNAKKSRLFGALAFTGLIFAPCALAFGIPAIKKGRRVKEGPYLKYAKQGILFSATAMVLSVLMLILQIYLHGDQMFGFFESMYNMIADLIAFVVNGPSS